MTASIAGAIFIVLMIVWKIIEWRAGINQKYEDAHNDAKKAVDSSDTSALLDALRRMRLYR